MAGAYRMVRIGETIEYGDVYSHMGGWVQVNYQRVGSHTTVADSIFRMFNISVEENKKVVVEIAVDTSINSKNKKARIITIDDN